MGENPPNHWSPLLIALLLIHWSLNWVSNILLGIHMLSRGSQSWRPLGEPKTCTYSALKLVYLRKPPFCHFFPIFPFTLSFSHNSKGSPISHHPKSLYGSLLCNLKYLLIFAERKKNGRDITEEIFS